MSLSSAQITTTQVTLLPATTLYLDLEISSDGKRLLELGAAMGNGELRTKKLTELETWIKRATHIVGHNLLRHDVPFLGSKAGQDLLSGKVLVDTLGWSALLYADKPYHKLDKGYKLEAEDAENNPLSDAKLCKRLLDELLGKFVELPPSVKTLYWCLLRGHSGYAGFFDLAGHAGSDQQDAASVIKELLAGQYCSQADVASMVREHPVELAHALALITTTEEASILPPWVVHALPVALDLVHRLRFSYCGNPACAYCTAKLDPASALQAHFGYPAFRRFDGDVGMGIQERAVRAALEGRSLLTVFPTGGGKSLTFQLPALMQGELTRSLTVVISPLVSLMKDQVEVLEERFQHVQAAHLSGLLSPLERREVLERVANGGIHLLYIAPETLRNPTLTRLLQKRHIARFVIDEAHCFSAWGQDFRVDYLFIAPFIQQLQADKGLADPIPVSCFTATAKPQVIADILSYFKQGLGLELETFISHARRENLAYEVVDLPDPDAKTRQRALLRVLHDSDRPAIVYASRTKRVEELVAIIQASGMNVRGYHGQMKREDKQANQEAFMRGGEVDVMVATKAFGMGVDKEDVHTVIHYNISSSLEEYVQEAGRAGRKAAINAQCFILYHPNDLSGHFQLLNRSKLNQKEIDQVWRAVKNLSKFRDRVSKSALELARAAGWDTEIKDLTNKVTASLAALEHSGYVKRTLNSPRIFASGLLVRDLEQALRLIRESTILDDKQKENCTRVMQRIIKEDETRVDEMADHLGMPLKLAVETIQHLRNLKVLNDQQDLTAFVDVRPRAGARSRFERITASERALAELIPGGTTTTSLRALNQALTDKGIDARTDEVGDLLRYWKKCRFIRTRRVDRLEQAYQIELLKSPEEIRKEMEPRHKHALHVLDHLLGLADGSADQGSKEERLVLFSLLGMQDVLKGGLFGEEVDTKRIERALLYLNESKVIRLEDGFMVIYQRLNVERVHQDPRKRFTQEDYEPLRLHYQNRVEQVHVVGEYARKRTESANAALAYVDDYFKLDHKAFIRKYFPKRETEITRPITRERFTALVGDLDTAQTAVVADPGSHILVAAGPGSGKTRVLVHKVANLLLLEDVKPEQFLMLSFSKAAALEFRSRIHTLVPEFRGLIKITTFHGLCFELLGQLGDLDKSETIIDRAIQAIKQKEVDVSALTNKSVLVLDEFQDVDANQWRLIQTIAEVAETPRIIAVGDDDQNIYEWRGASPEFMAAFRSRYNAKTHGLLTNYRSRASLVALSNHLVKRLHSRIKAGEVLTAKVQEPGVQRVVQYTGGYHLQGLVSDLVAQRYPGSTAVLTRTNEQALMATAMLQEQGIKARYIGGSDDFELGRLRELMAFAQIIRKAHPGVGILPAETWNRIRDQFLEGLALNRHREDFTDLIQRFEKEYPGRYDIGEWTDYVRQIRIGDVARTGEDSIFVSTMHKSKGREFTNVFLHLEGYAMDRDADLRLLYVACTRAMERLVIHTDAPFLPEYDDSTLVRESSSVEHPMPEQIDYVLGMRDVNLGSCWYEAAQINALRTGAELQPVARDFNNGPAPGLGTDDTCLLLYSQRFKDGPYAKLQQLGYSITAASVEYLVHWHNKERDVWHEVVLPRIRLQRGVAS